MRLGAVLGGVAVALPHLVEMWRVGSDETRTCAGAILERNAARYGDALALADGERRFGWSRLNAEANRVAAWAKAAGLRRGDCVALHAENRAEVVSLVVGLNKVGVVTAVLNPRLHGDPLRHVLERCAPRIVVAEAAAVAGIGAAVERLASPRPLLFRIGEASGGQFPHARETPELASVLPDEAPDPRETRDQLGRDVMMLLFTSGTTGLPKAALIRNRRFVSMAHGFAGVLLQARHDDVIYLPLPLHHATGAIAAFGSSLVSGAALAIRGRFSAREFWSDCDRLGATLFVYIGEVCRYLLASPPHPLERSHRLRLAAGAGLREDVWRAFEERFSIPRIVEFYGSTEGNVGIVNLEGRPGMLGRLLPGQCVVRIDPETEERVRDARGRLVEARVGERGILIGRIGKSTPFDGYLDASATRAKVLRDPFGDGIDWFDTGDLVELHAGRWVSFADRLGDTYRWKGENVSTLEVEDLLSRCRGVREATVYGVEVPKADGRAGMAAVVPAEGFEIGDFSAEVRAAFPIRLRPSFLRLRRELETTASFKHVKTRLRSEGIDVSKIADPLLYLDPIASEYRPLDAEILRRLSSGELRL
ncbi:fatty-acyl-CoA synthase [Myxococcaceae bacterium]|jgi:acyl-CoA synthetase (AMP-forming)/AMP-acid ligase II|nr:fatty-acyl-CoA synthase [Myxococcaceae bacterium]